jgi:hypothetical protein
LGERIRCQERHERCRCKQHLHGNTSSLPSPRPITVTANDCDLNGAPAAQSPKPKYVLLVLFDMRGFVLHNGQAYNSSGTLRPQRIGSLHCSAAPLFISCALTARMEDGSHARGRSGPALMTACGVRREKAALSSGCKSHPATAPVGSNRSSYGGNAVAEAFG